MNIEFEMINSTKEIITDSSTDKMLYNILKLKTDKNNEADLTKIGDYFICPNVNYFFYNDINDNFNDYNRNYVNGYENLGFINPVKDSSDIENWFDKILDINNYSNYRLSKSNILKVFDRDINYNKSSLQFLNLENHFIETYLDKVNYIEILLKTDKGDSYRWSDIKKYFDIHVYVNGIECSYREDNKMNADTNEGIGLIIDKTKVDVSSFNYIYIIFLNKIDYSIIKIDQLSGNKAHIDPFISYNKMTETNEDININCRYDLSLLGEFKTKNSKKDITNSGSLTFGGLRFNKSRINILPGSYEILTIKNDPQLNNDTNLSYLIPLNNLEKNEKYYISKLQNKENHIIQKNNSLSMENTVKIDYGETITIVYESTNEKNEENINSSLEFNFVSAYKNEFNNYSILKDNYGVSYDAIMELIILKNNSEEDINMDSVYSIIDTANFEGIGSEISLFNLNQKISSIPLLKSIDNKTDKVIIDGIEYNTEHNDWFKVDRTPCFIGYYMENDEDGFNFKHYLISNSKEEILNSGKEITLLENTPDFVYVNNQFSVLSKWNGIIKSYGIMVNSIKISNCKERYSIYYKDYKGNEIPINKENNNDYLDGFDDTLSDRLIIAPNPIVELFNNANIWGEYISNNELFTAILVTDETIRIDDEESVKIKKKEEENFVENFVEFVKKVTNAEDIIKLDRNILTYFEYLSGMFLYRFSFIQSYALNSKDEEIDEKLKNYGYSDLFNLMISKSCKDQIEFNNYIDYLVSLDNTEITDDILEKIIEKHDNLIGSVKNINEAYIYVDNIYIKKETNENINDTIYTTLDVTPINLNFNKLNSVNNGFSKDLKDCEWGCSIGTIPRNETDVSWFYTLPTDLDDNIEEEILKNKYSEDKNFRKITVNHNNESKWLISIMKNSTAYFCKFNEFYLNDKVFTSSTEAIFGYILNNNSNSKFQKEHIVEINHIKESDDFNKENYSELEFKNNIKYLTECIISYPEVIDIVLKSYKDNLTNERFYYPLINDNFSIDVSIKEGVKLLVDDIKIKMKSYNQPDVITPVYNDNNKVLNLVLNNIPFEKKNRVLEFIGEYTIDGEKTTFDFTTTLNITEIVDETDDTVIKYMETISNPLAKQILKREIIFITMSNDSTFLINLDDYFNEDFKTSEGIQYFINDNTVGLYQLVNLTDMSNLKFLESGVNFSYRKISDTIKKFSNENIAFDKLGIIARTIYNDFSETFNTAIIDNFIDKGNTLDNIITKLVRPNGSMFYQVVLQNKVEGFDYKIFIDGKEYLEGDILQNEQIEIATHKFRLYAFKDNDYRLIDSFVCGIDNTKPSMPLFKDISTYQIFSNEEPVNSDSDYIRTKYFLIERLKNPLKYINSEITTNNLSIFNLNKPIDSMNKIIPEEFQKLFGISVECLNIDSEGNPILSINSIKKDYINIYNRNDYPIKVEFIPSKDFYLDFETNSTNTDTLIIDEYFNINAKRYKISGGGSIKTSIKFSDKFFYHSDNNYSLKLRIQYIMNDEQKWYEIIFKFDNNSIKNENNIFNYIKELLPYRFYSKNDKDISEDNYEIEVGKKEISSLKPNLNNILEEVTEEVSYTLYNWNTKFENAEYFILDKSIIDLINFNTTYLYKLQLYLDEVLIYDSNKSDNLLISDNQLNYMLNNGKHIITLMTHKFNGTYNFKNYVIILAPNNYYKGIDKEDDLIYSRNSLIPRNEINGDYQFENELFLDSFANPSIVKKDKNGNYYLYKITENILQKLMDSKFIIENENIIREKLKSSFKEYSNYVNERYNILVDNIQKNIEENDTEPSVINSFINKIETIEKNILDKNIEKINNKTNNENKTLNEIDENQINNSNTIIIDSDYYKFKDKIKYTSKDIFIFKNLSISKNNLNIIFTQNNDYSSQIDSAIIAVVNIVPDSLTADSFSRISVRNSDNAEIKQLSYTYDENTGILSIKTKDLEDLNEGEYTLQLIISYNNTSINMTFSLIIEDVLNKITINGKTIANGKDHFNFFKSNYNNYSIDIYNKPSLINIENNTSLSINVKINSNTDLVLSPKNKINLDLFNLGLIPNEDNPTTIFESLTEYLNDNKEEKLNKCIINGNYLFEFDLNNNFNNKKLLLYSNKPSYTFTLSFNYINSEGTTIGNILKEGKTDYTLLFNKENIDSNGNGIYCLYNDTNNNYIGEIFYNYSDDGITLVNNSFNVDKNYSRYFIIPGGNEVSYNIDYFRKASDWLLTFDEINSEKCFNLLKERNIFILPSKCIIILRTTNKKNKLPIGLSFGNLNSNFDLDTIMKMNDPYKGLSIFSRNVEDSSITDGKYPLYWYEANSNRYPIEGKFFIEINSEYFGLLKDNYDDKFKESTNAINKILMSIKNQYDILNNITDNNSTNNEEILDIIDKFESTLFFNNGIFEIIKNIKKNLIESNDEEQKVHNALSKSVIYNKNFEIQKEILSNKASISEYKNYIYSVNHSFKKLVAEMNELLAEAYASTNKGFIFYYEKNTDSGVINTNINSLSRGYSIDVGGLGYFKKFDNEYKTDINFLPGLKTYELSSDISPYNNGDLFIDHLSYENTNSKYLLKAIKELNIENNNFINKIIKENNYSLKGSNKPGNKTLDDFINNP